MATKKKYSGIAKVGYDTNKKENICVKYRFNHIDKFIIFIEGKYPNVMWVNIFDKKTKQLTHTWGSRKGLEPARF